MAEEIPNDSSEEPQLPADATPEKIAIFEAVTGFYRSEAAELPLPQFTRPKARVYVHEVADGYGLYHRSEGKGKERHVILAKTAPKASCGFFDHTSQEWKHYTYTLGDELSNSARLDSTRTLRCLTFNVLHDPAERREEAALAQLKLASTAENSSQEVDSGKTVAAHDPTYAELRNPKCFDFLASRQAHIITLNEVSKEFYALLLKEVWVRDYWIAEFDDASLTPGNLILSRFPVKASFSHRFKLSNKINNLVEIVIPDVSETLWISTAHLKAGPFGSNGRFRRSQANEMVNQLKYLCPTPNYIIMGDLNIRTSENETLAALENWTDVWTTLHPSDPGLTYDPWNNSLAEFASSRICALDSTRVKVANRYDRILFRSSLLSPLSTTLLAQDPVGTMPNGKPLYIDRKSVV